MRYCPFAIEIAVAAAIPAITISLESISVFNGASVLGRNRFVRSIGVSTVAQKFTAVVTLNSLTLPPIFTVAVLGVLNVPAVNTLTSTISLLETVPGVFVHRPPLTLYSPPQIVIGTGHVIPVIGTGLESTVVLSCAEGIWVKLKSSGVSGVTTGATGATGAIIVLTLNSASFGPTYNVACVSSS